MPDTLLLHDVVLADDEWSDLLTAEDRRGLTPPLFCQHVLPDGQVRLDVTARRGIRTPAPPLT